MKINIKKLHPNALMPLYASKGAACFDLHVVEAINADDPAHGNPIVYRTGLAFEIPVGYVMLVFSRSGHAFKNDTRLANCVGVIDCDYRGEVMLKLTRDNSRAAPLIVQDRDRIAQVMVLPVSQVQFEVVDELSSTERGTGGFGSTGTGAL